MSKIILKSTNGSFFAEREYEASETVQDVKHYILQRFGNVSESINEKESVKIIYNGKIVSGNVPLGSLGCEGDICMKFIIRDNPSIKNENLNNDIEMTSVEQLTRVKIIDSGQKMRIDPSKIMTVNNKLVYVTKREKRISWIEEVRNTVKSLKMEYVFKLAVIFALFLTSNTEFGLLLTGVFILRLLSNLKFKVNMKDDSHYHFSKILYSFFISMFFLNSDQILDFTQETKIAVDN
ncbi:hypothetical protein GVAV_002470 [Gurleya vavrai]